jgi:hypothetical protein
MEETVSRDGANRLNKHSRIADTGWSSTLGVGCGAYLKKQSVTKCYTGPRTWTASVERPKVRKMNMRFETWKLRIWTL